jgi:hypothetical protein
VRFEINPHWYLKFYCTVLYYCCFSLLFVVVVVVVVVVKGIVSVQALSKSPLISWNLVRLMTSTFQHWIL